MKRKLALAMAVSMLLTSVPMNSFTALAEEAIIVEDVIVEETAEENPELAVSEPVEETEAYADPEAVSDEAAEAYADPEAVSDEAAEVYTEPATVSDGETAEDILIEGVEVIEDAPGEVTPEQAHALGVEFANRLLQDKYEAVVSTHLDHDHLHCHILFNSVSFTDGKKFRDNFKAYYGDIRGISNEVSLENNLSVIDPEGSGKSYAEWDASKKGKTTIRSLIREDIDTAIEASFTYAVSSP